MTIHYFNSSLTSSNPDFSIFECINTIGMTVCKIPNALIQFNAPLQDMILMNSVESIEVGEVKQFTNG